MVVAHPELATWQGLQKDWALFKTPASGDKGQLLVPDPAYVTNDASLIRSLKLNLKVVYAGGEAAQIDQIKQAYAKKQPLLFYWYTPQWLNAELSLSEVQLPARTPGCDTDLKKVTCAYPSYDPAQGHLDALREVGLAGGARDPALQLDRAGPGLGRDHDRRAEARPERGRAQVDRRQPGRRQGVALLIRPAPAAGTLSM